MTRDDVIRLADSASRILAEEATSGALTQIMDEIRTSWLNSRPGDVDGREDLFCMARAVQLLVTKLQAMQAAGVVESHNATQRDKDAKGQTAFH